MSGGLRTSHPAETGPSARSPIPAPAPHPGTRRRWGGVIAAILLGLSALSAFYPAWNPWRSPWIMQAGERLHWWNYEAEKR